MEKGVNLMALIASVTTGHILFLAMYLWVHTRNHLPNRILSALLFCYALRVIKSVLLLAFPGAPFSGILIALGVVGMSATGPLLFLYTQALLNEKFVFSYKQFKHFLLTGILLCTAFFLPDKLMFYVYQISVYQILIYTIAAVFFLLNKKKNNVPSSIYSWLKEVMVAMGCLWFVFLIQLYTGSNLIYTTVSLFAAIVFYTISLRAAFRKDVLNPVLKKKSKNNGGKKEALLPVIGQKLKDEKLYLDPLMSVSRFASIIKIPAYQLSAAINEESGLSFNEYLNRFRIEEAAQRLSSKKSDHLSIEAIAYDCGFNSLSAFYNAFKKIHNTTPAKFRQQQPVPDSEIRNTILKIG